MEIINKIKAMFKEKTEKERLQDKLRMAEKAGRFCSKMDKKRAKIE
ncbi:MAG: hypothetical protein QME12_07940 [Nanoarchaeota archaeon]|nr:hypothetical protein [Nanoarchaeota archaeon]